MKTDLFFNAANAARALSTAYRNIKRVWVFANAIWVWVAGKRPKFVSKRLFWAAFVNFRKAGAIGASVQPFCERLPDGDTVSGYEVRAAKGTEWHTVIPDGFGAINCDCEDYNRQIDTIGRGCCKHGYAVLNHLGFGSLREYVTATKTLFS